MSQTGRSQLIPNVLASGAAYVIAVGIGFIMPRVIYESLGSVPLGLWDLGWSFLAYVSFSGLGFSTAIAHYLSADLVNQNRESAGRILTNGFLLQILLAILLSLTFIVLFALLSRTQIVSQLNSQTLIMQIGIYLGAAVAVIVVGDFAQGILLALHKSRVGELINTIHDLVLAASMILCLLFDQGIIGLAVSTLVVRTFAEIARSSCAWFYSNPQHLRFGALAINPAFELVKYGAKSSIANMQDLLVYQSSRIILFISAGPLVLAAFSRYATIARQINRLIDRLSISLPALASEYETRSDHQRIEELYVSGVHGGVLVTLPILVIFAVFGDAIVTLWMGSEFVLPYLSWLLAGACLLHANYSICSRMVSGINRHGKIALFCLFLSGVVVYTLTILTFPQTPVVTAAMILATMVLTIQLPYIVFGKIALGTKLRALAQKAYLRAACANVLFLLLLLVANNQINLGNTVSGLFIAVISLLLLLLVYWHYVIGEKNRTTVRALFVS